MKEMGGDDIYMHIVSAQPDRHTDETWSGGLGIPVSNSGKWFVILETRGMIQNQNEDTRGNNIYLDFITSTRTIDTGAHRGLT